MSFETSSCAAACAARSDARAASSAAIRSSGLALVAVDYLVTILYNQELKPLWWSASKHLEPAAAKGTRTRVLWEGDEAVLTSEHDGVVFDFVEAILQKRKPQTSLQDALLFARIADAIYASSATGKPVSFD